MKKILKQTMVLVVGLVAVGALLTLAAPVAAKAELAPVPESVNFLSGTTTLTANTATTNANTTKTLKIEPGRNVAVTFNVTGAGSSTTTNTAWWQYKCGEAPWSKDLIVTSKVLAGTVNVVGAWTLTNGVSFPSEATELRLFYLTNNAAVTTYHSNLYATTWRIQR